MSTFEVLVSKVAEVSDLPNSDRLSLIKINDYICVSAKLEDGSPRYQAGELVVYVPEGTIVPETLLRQGFWDEDKKMGILAGSQGDRVKAIKLRGQLSQGIIFPLIKSDDGVLGVRGWSGGFMPVEEGTNVAEFMGFKKYEPTIPASMSGDLYNLGTNYTLKYDIENIKRYPDILQDGENVVMTEKLHGTFCMVGYHRKLDDINLFANQVFVASKGLGAQGLVFKHNAQNIATNMYVRTLMDLDILNKVAHYCQDELLNDFEHLVICGEVFGRGVQDLGYGFTKPTFRAFDVFAAKAGHTGKWLSVSGKGALLKHLEIDEVPTLYSGPFSKDVMLTHTSGMTTFDGQNIREGIVITPWEEREARGLGRVILKSVSPDYLLRKGGTEFN